jgi:hypothetical protein
VAAAADTAVLAGQLAAQMEQLELRMVLAEEHKQLAELVECR